MVAWVRGGPFAITVERASRASGPPACGCPASAPTSAGRPPQSMRSRGPFCSAPGPESPVRCARRSSPHVPVRLRYAAVADRGNAPGPGNPASFVPGREGASNAAVFSGDPAESLVRARRRHMLGDHARAERAATAPADARADRIDRRACDADAPSVVFFRLRGQSLRSANSRERNTGPDDVRRLSARTRPRVSTGIAAPARPSTWSLEKDVAEPVQRTRASSARLSARGSQHRLCCGPPFGRLLWLNAVDPIGAVP